MKKKVIGIILAMSMVLSCLSISSFVSQARTTESAEVSAQVSESVGTDYKLAKNIQDGVILHCFDWKYNDIKAELPNIAKAGFSAVQTSPVQANNNHGTWYWLYLPRGFYIDTNDLGTKEELAALCTEADKYGIKVVVDVVANHLEGNHSNIVEDLKPSQYWHSYGSVNSWYDRYQVTHGDIGMADLATENPYVQSVVKRYIDELKGIGVDGIRFDAAKHIGLPSEGDDFWKVVTSDKSLWYYGEILVAPDDRDTGNEDLMKEYTDYMTVTDSVYGKTIRDAFAGGNAPDYFGNWVARGIAGDKLIYWAESHDTWSNGYDWGYSWNISQNNIDRAYAVAASRNNTTALYFSRPSSNQKEQIKAGQKGSTHFTSSEVAEVNKFHNAMVGKEDYYLKSNGCSVITRKDGGAVIVKGSGSGQVSVTNGGNYAKPGTYVDRISGNTFTVTSSSISGNIGSSGIAVIYEEEIVPTASVTPESQSYKTDTLTLTLNCQNATNAQYSIDGGAYKSYTDGSTITIGSGLAYGTKTTVSVKATDGTTTSEVQTYTYTKVDPSLVQTAYFDNSAYNWSNVYAYIYTDEALNNGEWPGQQMTKDSATGYYAIEIPESLSNGYIIFTESKDATTNRYPADGQSGLALGGNSMIMKADHIWEVYTKVPETTAKPTTQPTTVAPTTQPATTPAQKVLIGDVNLDGVITITDATDIQYHLCEQKALSENGKVAADVDGNGVINIKDATKIQFYLVDITSASGRCGEYVDIVDPTQPTTSPTINYLYYRNTNNWSTVKAYYWSDSNQEMTVWPGVDATSTGDNIYRVEVPSDAQYIIFNNGGSEKTDDLTIEGFNKIYENNVWNDYSIETPTEPSENYIYFYNSSGWNSVNAYYWSESNITMTVWPGVAMENIGNNTYRIELPNDAEYIIFSNNGSNQSDNLKLEGMNKIYKDGSWSVFNG